MNNHTILFAITVVLLYNCAYLTHTHALFWGHWYPCFGFLMTSLGFNAVVGPDLFALVETNIMHIPPGSTSGATPADLFDGDMYQQKWEWTPIWMGNHPQSRRTSYHCASDPTIIPAVLTAVCDWRGPEAARGWVGGGALGTLVAVLLVQLRVVEARGTGCAPRAAHKLSRLTDCEKINIYLKVYNVYLLDCSRTIFSEACSTQKPRTVLININVTSGPGRQTGPHAQITKLYLNDPAKTDKISAQMLA